MFVLNVDTILNTLTVYSTCTALYMNKYVVRLCNIYNCYNIFLYYVSI